MSGIIVEMVGPATSVQDTGRYGLQRYGLGPSGAVDRLGLAMANALAGQPLDAAVVELGPLGATLRATGAAVRIGIAGAERAVRIGGQPVRCNTSQRVDAGEIIEFGAARDGVYSYLAFTGGIAGERAFGSISVNARAGLGSPYPRALCVGDFLGIGSRGDETDECALVVDQPSGPIRIVLGPQQDHFDDATIALFLASDWRVSANSDRMGARLDGPHLTQRFGGNIVSDGTVNGNIQVPASGQPLVLLPDRGTTGGYPKIGTIISADLGRFCQAPAGAIVRFAAISIAEAEQAARDFLQLIASLPGRLRVLGPGGGIAERLHDANLAGQAVNALDTETWQDASASSDPESTGEPS